MKTLKSPFGYSSKGFRFIRQYKAQFGSRKNIVLAKRFGKILK